MPGKRRAIHPSMRRRSRSDGQSFLPLWGGADARAAFVCSRAKACFSVIWIVQGNAQRAQNLDFIRVFRMRMQPLAAARV